LAFVSFLADARRAGQTRGVSACRIRRTEYLGGTAGQRSKKHCKSLRFRNLWRAFQTWRRSRDSMCPLSAKSSEIFVYDLSPAMARIFIVSFVPCPCTISYRFTTRVEGSLRAVSCCSKRPDVPPSPWPARELGSRLRGHGTLETPLDRQLRGPLRRHRRPSTWPHATKRYQDLRRGQVAPQLHWLSLLATVARLARSLSEPTRM